LNFGINHERPPVPAANKLADLLHAHITTTQNSIRRAQELQAAAYDANRVYIYTFARGDLVLLGRAGLELHNSPLSNKHSSSV
ncbi:MAG: hypothetical protein BJ554DRAFT_5088, partial [Olpidium bornovanus]